MHPTTPRRGLTLVELLAVIAIIGLLVGMLLPAVQSARESARRTICGNNLRQIALGILSHEQQMGTFPVGTPQHACGDDPVELARQGLFADGVSWMVRVLPFIEQQPLFSSMRITGNASDGLGIVTNDPATRRAIATAVPTYYCPSDNAAGKTRTDVWTVYNVPFAVTNYGGVIGPVRVESASTVVESGLNDYCNNRCPYPDRISCPGSFWRHSYRAPVRLASFHDGASNTQIVGERLPEIHTFAIWAISNGTFGFHTAPLNFFDRPAGFYTAPTSLTLGGTAHHYPAGAARWAYAGHSGFGSRHPGGAIFAYADGRTAFCDDLIDTVAYRALSTRRGRETVSLP